MAENCLSIGGRRIISTMNIGVLLYNVLLLMYKSPVILGVSRNFRTTISADLQTVAPPFTVYVKCINCGQYSEWDVYRTGIKLI